jgi:dTDP-4-amino-4,6-dideoxygalactose transaminase
LEEIAARHGLRLLFDAAHALGCTYRGRMIGGFGDAEVFSFHATKFVNSFEGGAVVTNDDELAGQIRLMKNFGFTAYDATGGVGLNGKMTEVAAAMGLTNLESMERFVAANLRNYEHYRRRLAGIDGIEVAEFGGDGESSNYQYIAIEIDEDRTGVDRDAVMDFLHGEYVLARRYFYPGCHQMEPYRSVAPELRLPETERLAARILALPTGTAVTDDDVDRVCDLIEAVVEGRDSTGRVLQRLVDSA